ncbi:hypothetical protein [Aquipuribacter sp. SD81]|uniref:hypothetical protein n=1 Tax=Aquipuribacter sp. SD81 TaxID=3127703 RepID=UPI0030185A4E
MSQLVVRWDWTAVGAIHIAEDGQTLDWPAMPAGAGVYRINLHLGERTRTYIGETDRYARRFRHYDRPGPSQTTNRRMKERLVTLLGVHGGTASVDVATSVSLESDRGPVELSNLPPVFVRRLLENAALCVERARGGEVVNGPGFPKGELWPD